ANMGLIADIKQQLREVNALKVNYTTYEGNAFNNLQ
ncbi:MAG: biopolymer transporter ExbD, partial [Allomuricauda sp.]